MRIKLDFPPGLLGDDTSYSAAGRWRDASNVRFWRGAAQVVGGWEQIFGEPLAGVCRTVFQWTDNAAAQNIGFGTHSALMVWQSGELADITPAGLGAGSVDGTGGAGFGTGAYSTGGYSEPSVADYFPRTWSLGAWGQTLLASPRGGKLYKWLNDTSAAAVEVGGGAPSRIAHMLVAPQDQVFALGCEEEVSGEFNPLCIRHSGVRDLDSWTTGPATTAREYVLPGGGRIVAGRVMGPYLLVWTTHALFVGVFVGAPGQVWKFDRVGQNCGLIGPNAAVVVGQQAFWIGPDLQFWSYGLGGAPAVLPCPIREAVKDNLAPSQGDKIVAASISQFNEIRFDYPDVRDGVENSRYVAMSLQDGAWSRGRMARTAFVDAGPSQHPIGVDAASRVYWHERGHSADGDAFPWFIESADRYIDENATMMALGMWPDLAEQQGGVMITLASRDTPQGEERTSGPHGMVPGQSKVDLRMSGRLFRIRFSGQSAPTFARIGTPAFDVAGAGRR